ncbi:hypothetical protein VULLAG_LOCUS583 [Vulpes lagopus]
MVTAPAPLLLGLGLAAQAHRPHFDRKHPADLNRGFGRQEEPRRNGSHLVCLSESERRRWLRRRRRELLRSYTSQGLPPFPRPLPRPFSPPQAAQPAQHPAESKVSCSAGPSYPPAPSPTPSLRPAAWERDPRAGGGRRREPRPRPGTVAALPPCGPRSGGAARPGPACPGPALGRTRAARARSIAGSAADGPGRFAGRQSRDSASPSGAASRETGRRRERRRFERARSGTGPPTRVKMAVWGAAGREAAAAAAAGAGGSGQLGGAAGVRPRGCGGPRRAGLAAGGRSGRGGRQAPLPAPLLPLLPHPHTPPFFLKETFYVGNIAYRTDR